MTHLTRTLIGGLGLAWILFAALGIWTGYPQPFDSSRAGGWINGEGAFALAGGLAVVAGLHFWLATTDSDIATIAARLIGAAGLVVGLVGIAVLPPVGVVLVAAYGFILWTVLRRDDLRQADRLRRHLDRR